MTIDHKPTEPKIPEPPLGVSREILGDPSGGDGGGGGQNRMLGARKEEQRGESRRSKGRRKLGAWTGGRRGSRSITERTGHARYAAEEPLVYRKNPRDGTWRRSGGVLQPGPVSLAQSGQWRPWVDQEEAEERVQTVVSIANPSDNNHPVYYTSTDIRERAHFQNGKCNRNINSLNDFSSLKMLPFRHI